MGNGRVFCYYDANLHQAKTIQEAHYYPFGLPIQKLSPNFEASVGVEANNYQYNGIELVEDFGLHVNHAAFRTLDPQIGRWWQIDPLAELAPGWTPYRFGLDNPLLFKDDNGLLETYGVTPDGVITKIDDKKYYDENGNEVDMLVVGEKVKLDKKGEIKNQKTEVKKNVLKQASVKSAKVSVGNKEEITEYTNIDFGGNDEDANKLFKFLADNTDVEWSIFQTDEGYENFKNTKIYTSHTYDSEPVGSMHLERNPFGLIYHKHSHPRTNVMFDTSRLIPSQEDEKFAEKMRQYAPLAKFILYFNNNTKPY
ncbi:MAG: hypothetical protein IPM47_20360 [Sphingobacteriales bacterium]|nr:MAG: hypothetical protein IPM47_20360 [Sphingobacteriales bacterium]